MRASLTDKNKPLSTKYRAVQKEEEV